MNTAQATRRRLPNRRGCETHTLAVGNTTVTATVGFDAAGQPAEVFLSGGKVGTDLDAMLGDAAVAISVALQYGIPPGALAKSVGRTPETVDGPESRFADWDRARHAGRLIAGARNRVRYGGPLPAVGTNLVRAGFARPGGSKSPGHGARTGARLHAQSREIE
jgi:hypothetical protein